MWQSMNTVRNETSKAEDKHNLMNLFRTFAVCGIAATALAFTNSAYAHDHHDDRHGHGDREGGRSGRNSHYGGRGHDRHGGSWDRHYGAGHGRGYYGGSYYDE